MPFWKPAPSAPSPMPQPSAPVPTPLSSAPVLMASAPLTSVPVECFSVHCQRTPLEFKCKCQLQRGICYDCAVGLRQSGSSEQCPFCRTNVSDELTRLGVPPRKADGFSTVEACINQTCRMYMQEVQSNSWVQGTEINLVEEDSEDCGFCKEPRAILKLRFRKCHAQFVMCTEASTGQRTWTTEDKYCHAPTDFPVPWNQRIRLLRVSTSSSQKIRPPPPQKKEVGKGIGEEHVFIDDAWMTSFLDQCAAAGTPTTAQILQSLQDGNELTSSEVRQVKKMTKDRKLLLFRHGEFRLECSQGPTAPPQIFAFPEEAEDSIMNIYWYTLQTPPIFERVSQILNNPTLRVSNLGKVQAVIPFVQGLMNAMEQVKAMQPNLWVGPVEAWRGVEFRYSDQQWSKFQPGNKICWYTVKSLTATPEAITELLGPARTATIFEVFNCFGVKIRAFSAYENEDEVLLRPGAKFEVMRAERSQTPADPDVWRRADRIWLRMVA